MTEHPHEHLHMYTPNCVVRFMFYTHTTSYTFVSIHTRMGQQGGGGGGVGEEVKRG